MAGSNLGHMIAEVGLNIDPFKQSAEVLKKQTKSLQSHTKAMEATFKGTGKSLTGLKSVFTSLGAELTSHKALLASQQAAYEAYKNKIGDVNNATDKQKQRLLNMENEMSKTEGKIQTLTARYSQMAQEIATKSSVWTKAGDKLNSFGAKMDGMGQKMSAFGSSATRKLTTPIMIGLGAAAKEAVSFNSEIDKIGPLLTNGGAVTKEFRGQLDQMAESSKKWSMQYGVSTKDINVGLEELVKKGYDANQTMGAMPSILDATRASGDGFIDVMSVSTSVLEQFGLKTENTKGMIENTSRVTDTLTYVANATAAGFMDMGEAMKYVGPVANGAGISLEETAAAIGLMSNKGIEGSVAGTALRGALTKLMKPSKQNAAGFALLGVEVGKFRDGSMTLPDMLNTIKKNTEGLTAAEKGRRIALAFGTEAQSGMNALISAGGDELTELIKDTEGARGSTKKIAEEMGNTAQAKVQKFKSAVQVLGIEFGQKLLPTLTPLIEKLTSMVQKFAEMDDKTQQNIINTGLFVAAVGPLAKVLGTVTSGIGKTSQGLGALFNLFGKMSGKANAAKVAAEGLEGTLENTGGMAKVLPALFSPVGLAVTGVTAAIGIGWLAWETYGKKAVEATDRAHKWGSDVGKEADGTLTKFRDLSYGITDAVSTTAKGVNGKTKDITKSFQTMYEDIKKAAEKNNDEIDELIKKLPAEMQKNATKAAEKQKETNSKSVELAQQAANQINDVYARHNGDLSKLTNEEKEIVVSNTKIMNQERVRQMKLGKEQEKQVIAALNGDIDGMNKKQRESTMKDLLKMHMDTNVEYEKNKERIKKIYGEGTDEYKTQLKTLDGLYNESTLNQAESFARLAEANGKHHDDIYQDLRKFNLTTEQFGEVWDRLGSKVVSKSKIIAKSTKKMSQDTEKANLDWNSLALDPKTGEVKTNLKEFLTETSQSEDGWKKIDFIVKNANLSSNAKMVLSDTVLENGKWDTMKWEEKKLLIQDEGTQVVVKALEESGKWNELSVQEKELLLHSDTPEKVQSAMQQIGVWGEYPVPSKELTANTADFYMKMQNSQKTLDQYNVTDPDFKQLIADGTLSDSTILNSEGLLETFNNLDPDLKHLLAESFNLKTETKNGKQVIVDYNSKNPAKKVFKGDSSSMVSSKNDILKAKSAIDSVPNDQTKKYTLKNITQNITEFFTKRHKRGTFNTHGDMVLGDGGKPEVYQRGDTGEIGITPPTDTVYRNMPLSTKVWSSVDKFNADMQGNTKAQRMLSKGLATKKMESQSSNPTMDSSAVLNMLNDIKNKLDSGSDGEININIDVPQGFNMNDREMLQKLAEQIAKTIKQQEDRKKFSRGEAVNF